ncbi:hypothetical protein TDB9533_00461 [Thalassocella blandensis]|nr:hypothetical protein TDB9533_00461 [Thalassocella blandensis]
MTSFSVFQAGIVIALLALVKTQLRTKLNGVKSTVSVFSLHTCRFRWPFNIHLKFINFSFMGEQALRYRQSTLWVACLLMALTLCCMCYVLVNGSFVKQMVLHIALMGPVACLAASWLLQSKMQFSPLFNSLIAKLWLATSIQLAIFLVFHLPFNLHGSHSGPAAGIMLVLMFGAALWFWLCVLGMEHNKTWQSMLALLVTGKIFCLVAVLMIFSPRSLYASMHTPVLLDEQQLAGLLMVVACPMSYILAAVVLCVRWLNAISFQADSAVADWKDA